MFQFITHHTARYSEIEGARLALEGGCRWIQLRAKEATDAERYILAVRLQTLCRDFDATFIIDDYVDLAQSICADGVHLGKNDMSPAAARDTLGDSYIIGGTANTYTDMVYLNELGVDYIGLGPFRFTQTKKNLSPTLGLEGYRSCMAQCVQSGITLPVVAIGGIELADIADILATGVHGVALSGLILRADDPVETTKQLIKSIQQ